MQGPEAKNAAAFLSANDPAAANAALKSYIRYGDNTEPVRLQYAENFMNAGGGAVKQYDAAGNPVQPQAPQQPVPLAPQSEPQQNAPASPPAPSPDDDALLAKYLGGAPQQASSQGTAAASAPATSAASNDDDALLEKYLGAPTTNPFGTTAKPGTPEYAKAAIAAVQSGAQLPVADPTQHPEVQPAADVVPDWARAFSENAVNSVPVAGPLLHDARNALMGPQGGAEMDALGQSASAANPLAAGAGTVFGTVAPLAAAGTTAVGARLLGMSGGLGARMLMGAGSGGVVSGLDTLARGGSPQQAGQNALLGAGIGGAVPVAGKVLGAAKDAFLGPSANKMVSNALLADKNDPAQVNQLLQNMGPGATIADLGPNTQGLATGMASLPGEPKAIVVNNLKARAADTGNRLAADVAGTIGAGQPVGALTDSIVAAQKAAADPLYASVRPAPVQMTPTLQSLGNTPLGRQAFQKAAQMMANDGLSGTGTTVGFFDYAKQALDDITSSALRSGESNAARQAGQMANTITSEVDQQVPQYAAARDAFAGPAKVLDAVDMGQSIFGGKTTPEDLQRAMAGMSASEKDGLLAGAQAAVQKAIGSARTNAAGVKSLFDSDFGKEKLAVLVGQPEADKIAAAIERERGFSETAGKAYRNSVTSANLAQQKVISPDLAAIPGKAPPQTWQGMALAGLEKARNAITSKYRNAQNIRAANMLTAPSPSPQALQGVSGAATPRNALMAPATAPLLAKQGGIGVGNMLTWANPDQLPPGSGGPNGPLRIVVRGANAAQ
jgi:hypothetical protein